MKNSFASRRESIRPLDNVEHRKTFLDSFNWHGSVLTDEKKKTESPIGVQRHNYKTSP